MGSISSAAWVSLASGWLLAAAATAVVAAAPDDSPGLVLVPAPAAKHEQLAVGEKPIRPGLPLVTVPRGTTR